MNFQVLEFNGEGNHVHALIEYPTKLSISQIVNALKGVSSRRYGQAGHKKPHKEALLSPSYFAVSVGGAPLEILKEYIRNQEKPATEEGLVSQFLGDNSPDVTMFAVSTPLRQSHNLICEFFELSIKIAVQVPT